MISYLVSKDHKDILNQFPLCARRSFSGKKQSTLIIYYHLRDRQETSPNKLLFEHTYSFTPTLTDHSQIV